MSELDRASLDRTLPPRSGSADWDEVLRGAGRGRRGRRLVAIVAAVLLVVVGTASSFGTVRDLLGLGTPVGDALYAMQGKRGRFFLRDISITDAGDRSQGWRIEVVPGDAREGFSSTGQYADVTGRGRQGGLRMFRSPRWQARLEGFVTRPGEATQRIVITVKGGVQGVVFVLTPLQPGILKRDSGTVSLTGR